MFVESMLNLVFFPFRQSESVLFLTVFGVFLFCFSFALIRKLMRVF